MSPEVQVSACFVEYEMKSANGTAAAICNSNVSIHHLEGCCITCNVKPLWGQGDFRLVAGERAQLGAEACLVDVVPQICRHNMLAQVTGEDKSWYVSINRNTRSLPSMGGSGDFFASSTSASTCRPHGDMRQAGCATSPHFPAWAACRCPKPSLMSLPRHITALVPMQGRLTRCAGQSSLVRSRALSCQPATLGIMHQAPESPSQLPTS